MNRSSAFPALRHFGRLLGTALAAVTLASCGGGDGVIGSGGTGSPLGMAVGTVNGFGSVIVDGLRYDDRAATVVVEVAPGVDVFGEVRLGDRVSVAYEAAGIAKTVRLEAAAAGRVDSVDASGRFSMLGQSVSINTSGTAGPITQFGSGYAQASDLRPGDLVEVHGLLVRQGGAVQIQATRIDKLDVAPAYLRVSGIVGALQAGAETRFTMGAVTVDASSAAVLPAGTVLANGQAVTVLALPTGLTNPASGGRRLLAAQIRIRELRDGGIEDVYSGSVSHLDSGAKSFELGGLRVDFGSAMLAPAGWTPADGQYVLVSGTVAADGSLRAATVSQRDTGSQSEAELHGNITGYDVVTGRFNVRDVLVDASAAVLEGCPVGGLANGLYVEIEGSLGSNGVTARKLHCGDEPVDASVEREGIAGTVDAATRSLVLATEHGASVPVRWTETTYFGGLTPSTLSGQQVKVEGSFADGVLVARKIKRED